jgi:hypothetical protein
MRKKTVLMAIFLVLAISLAAVIFCGCREVGFIPGASYGYYIWEEGGRLHIFWSIDRKDASFSGSVSTDGSIDDVEAAAWEDEDAWEIKGDTLSYESTLDADDYMDGIILDITGYTYIEMDPGINDGHDLSRVHVGAFLNNPEASPFRIGPGYFEEIRKIPWYDRHPFSGLFYKLYANKYFTFAFLSVIGAAAIELLRITAFWKKKRARLYAGISYIALISLEIAVYYLLRFFVL